MRRLRRTSEKPCWSRDRTVASSPQPIGEGTPAGGGGRWALKILNIFPNKPFRRPIGQCDLPSGPGHAPQFGGSNLGSWREHNAKHAHDEIELTVSER